MRLASSRCSGRDDGTDGAQSRGMKAARVLFLAVFGADDGARLTTAAQ